ncbi:Rpn family recombination-promoting nuclease/putative transposase [Eubacterium sp. MSJ-13]|uniref:Rpn family recombination-promoting nuclease/putative transposase n=1 Tax=Eubacterium sp. MSJ-13 TaxID=2841513 RepID=UPI001C107EB7|nr:Rpn family recombination-promoting nuclease/putative transposase [Eubacterium sp. MSJ-13]MBU5477850.1 Rpn family recombination-promoting nuclease/putative transposase [Eubacterium sp. MSJ-13]
MGKVDIATKQYMSHRDIIADAFNFYIYDGRQVIKPERLQKIDTAEIALPYGNDADTAVQKLRDNLMLWTMAMDDKAMYVVLGIENQDKVHYAMAVKNMLYDALQYAKQVEESKRSYRDKSKERTVKLNSEEFLSGLKRDDKLMPVITLVIYFGDKDWDGAKSIHEMLSVDDDEILSYIPDYKINLIEPAKISDDEFDKFQTDLGTIIQFIKHQSDEDGSWIKGKKRFEHVEREAVELINLITGSKFAGNHKEEVVDMCRAWENSINNAKNEGIREGMREGIREGELKGKIETLYEECDMSIPDIAKKVSKPEEYVKEVIERMSAAYL